MSTDKNALAVFVHGIGANDKEWWGTTPDAFRSDSDLKHIDLQFWGYDTQKHPERFWALPNFFRAKSLANLEQLGRLLWGHLLSQHKKSSYSEVGLFGHSMGGLVVAAAIVEGWPRLSPADMALKSALKVIGLCATPLGGSSLANLVKHFTAIYGANEHMNNLCEDSATRKRIVAQLENYVRLKDGDSERVLLEFFEVPEDTTVHLDQERYAGFLDSSERKQRLRSLFGGHSECVQDLSSKGNLQANYAVISDWLKHHLTGARPVVSAHSQPAKPSREQTDISAAIGKEDRAVMLLRDTLLAGVDGRGGQELALKLVTEMQRLTALSGEGVLNACRFFIEYNLLVSEDPSSPALLEAMLFPAQGAKTPRVIGLLAQGGKTANFGAVPIQVISNFFRRARDREEEWKAYFDALVKHAGLTEGQVMSVSRVAVRLGYLAPQFLVAGLLARFNEDWAPLLNAYVDAVPDPKQRRGPFESLQASQWNCWLMWGPSIPLCQCDQWRGLFAFQYGYGDENNSLPVVEVDVDDQGMPKALTTISNLMRSERRGARYAKLVGRLRWAPSFLRESEPGDKQHFNAARKDFDDEDSETDKLPAAPAQSALYATRGPAPREDRDGLVLQLDTVEDSNPESRVYFSAYLWLIFLVALPPRIPGGAPTLLRGKPYPNWPTNEDEREAVRRKGLWADLLPVFVHANIGDPDALAFQRRILVNNAMELLKQVWTQRQQLFQPDDVSRGIQFHLVCASDYSGCGCEVRFPPSQPLVELLRAGLATELNKDFAAAMVLPPVGETEESRPWELRGFFSSCHLPELVADYYVHVDEVNKAARATK